MEGELRGPIEQKKEVPLADDLVAYISLLEEGQREDEDRLQKLRMRIEAEKPIPMPLSVTAKYDVIANRDRLGRHVFALKQGREDIKRGGIPSAAYVEALRESWYRERQNIQDQRDRMNVLRRRHAEGEHLSKAELAELNFLAKELVEIEERSKRMRGRIRSIVEMKEAAEQANATGETTEQKRARRERVDRKLDVLEADPRNMFLEDEGDVEPEEEEDTALTTRPPAQRAA